MTSDQDHRDLGIWGYALGYFLCYAPYSALTKLVSQGKIPGMARGISGFAVLPISTIASLAGMMIFITAMGWWKHAGRREVLGLRVVAPGRWTFLSGLCSAAIIGTTTLSYTFSGVSIVFMMLLMRGGVLVIAPLVDAVSRRKVRWSSWASLALSLGALLVAFAEGASWELTAVAAADVAIYLASYFIRLRFMSRLAKSDDPAARTRYFVEEQMVATPAIVLALAVAAILGQGDLMADVRWGFTGIWSSGAALAVLAVGFLSQGTGIFGGLILLDRRENTFCVPVNRASSILAGLLATLGLSTFAGAKALPTSELIGAALIIAAMAVLAAPAVLARRGAAEPAPRSAP
ncbi:MAG: hypothetical protein IT372_18985 [Polyangiaceae bacterium]|nr:hypothetical protein [Polyangiaceae bacterium]